MNARPAAVQITDLDGLVAELEDERRQLVERLAEVDESIAVFTRWRDHLTVREAAERAA